nr:unnamed protein product [Callosobruchus chinensis]
MKGTDLKIDNLQIVEYHVSPACAKDMEIPYGKILVYLLTFLVYIFSGYGSGLLINLRDAVLSAETVFGDVMKNVIHVAKKFRSLHDVFDAAVEEECIFKCPSAIETAVEEKPNNHSESVSRRSII